MKIIAGFIIGFGSLWEFGGIVIGVALVWWGFMTHLIDKDES